MQESLLPHRSYVATDHAARLLGLRCIRIGNHKVSASNAGTRHDCSSQGADPTRRPFRECSTMSLFNSKADPEPGDITGSEALRQRLKNYVRARPLISLALDITDNLAHKSQREAARTIASRMSGDASGEVTDSEGNPLRRTAGQAAECGADLIEENGDSLTDDITIEIVAHTSTRIAA